MAHAEEHLANAGCLMMDGHRPWLLTWQPTGDDPPVWRIIGGNTIADARAAAAQTMREAHFTPDGSERLYAFTDGAFPMSGELVGSSGTPNHKREGIACWALYCWLFAREKWPAARTALVRMLRFGLDVGMWAVPGGKRVDGRPLSEAFGPSHGRWHLAADGMAALAAELSQDQELRSLVAEHWGQLLAYVNLITVIDADGRVFVLTVGPRATRKTKDGGSRRMGTDPALDGLGAEVAFPGRALPDNKIRGGDMLGVATFRSIRRITKARGEQWPAVTPTLPRTVDPIVIGRSGPDLGVWVEGSGTNNTDPGYAWAASRTYTEDKSGKNLFFVEPSNVQEELGFVGRGHSLNPEHRAWDRVWRTRTATAA